MALAAGAGLTMSAAGVLAEAGGFRVRSLTLPYDTGALFAMPHERIALAIVGPARPLFSLDTPEGALTAISPNRWTWEAPGEQGGYPVEARLPSRGKVLDFTAFVMVPASRVQGGVLNGFRIGSYPARRPDGNPAYVPPRGFIEVTRSNQDTKVSPHFRLKQFLTKQQGGYPKYLVLDERLLFVLESIGAKLQSRGWDAGDMVVMSGYRTPFYNKAIGDTAYSMHQWGRACDFFLDKNHDGVMDDFNGDRTIDRLDAAALAGVLEDLAGGELSGFIGGIGVYAATAAHGPFVHVDTRPWKARW